jgi:hypothetical protein
MPFYGRSFDCSCNFSIPGPLYVKWSPVNNGEKEREAVLPLNLLLLQDRRPSMEKPPFKDLKVGVRSQERPMCFS